MAIIIESKPLEDYEIWTDTGWEDVSHIHKTMPYIVWEITTPSFTLRCADEHILFNKNYAEIFVKDLKVGDEILTENGVEAILSVLKTETSENMFDVSVNSDNHRMYTNGILSHNSTIATIYLLWLANFFPDQKILLVANKETTAIEIFQRVRMAYEMLPGWLKAPVVEYAKTAMELDNGSSIKVSTTTGTAGRGSACSYLVLDECGHIEPHLLDSFYASVFPIISSSKKAKVFMCSTPNGTGNLFHSTYTKAVEGKNGWGHDKILWSDVPGRDEQWAEEIRLGLGSDEKWRQEFGGEFINSGTSSLSDDLYRELKKNLQEPIETLMDGKYRIWELPNPDSLYIAGVDVSDGVGGDYSVIKILDATDLREIKEVAEYYDNTIPVFDFSNKCYEILQHWGLPFVAVERNNQGGQVVDRLDKDFNYPRIVSWGAKTSVRKNTELLGMISSRNTKYNACANARYWYNDSKSYVFRDSASLEEVFKDFVKINDTWGAAAGKHDDRTMALVWALKILDNDVVADWFSIDEVDECGKPRLITPFAWDNTTRATSIYTNEQVDNIEHSMLSPMTFGSFGGPMESDFAALKAEGWQLLGGGEPYIDPSRNMSKEHMDCIDKYFG